MPRHKSKPEPHSTPSPSWLLDEANPATHHRLEGLEPDNLLAFLALLGLLRALETARPEWRPRAWWPPCEQPWRPALALDVAATRSDLQTVAAEATAALARAFSITGDAKDLKFSLDEFQSLRKGADPEQGQVLDSLGSDFAFEERKGKDKEKNRKDGEGDQKGKEKENKTLVATPFCFMFGQGHQHFLQRLRGVQEARERGEEAARAIGASLFASWKRDGKGGGFRWDPAEDRRYALRASNPSKEGTVVEEGANLLAAIALPTFPVFSVRRSTVWRLLTPTTRYAADGSIEFSWPLWSRPASSAAIRALLTHPELSADTPQLDRLPDVHAVWRARRISVGKYFSATVAARVA